MGNLEGVKKEIVEFDVSAYSDKFKLAKEVLLGNNDQAIVFLHKVFPDVIDAPALEKWPLFISFRESEQYKLFKEQHMDEFKLSSVEIEREGPCIQITENQ